MCIRDSAGTSHLDLTKLNQHKYGSELMNIVADATLPGALATFKYDDEGTPAQRVEIVKEGIWTGVLSGRVQQSQELNLEEWFEQMGSVDFLW